MELRPATLEEIIALREAVIIRGTHRPREFPGDRDSTTHHFGAFDGGQNVACATLLLTEWHGTPAYQLRGMATAPDYQNQGIGAALLDFSERHILEHTPVRQLWCNARTTAVSFYERNGWSRASDVFDVPDVGEHRKLCKRLTENRRD